MTESLTIDPNDGLLESPFMVEMVRQLRALDTYGYHESKGPAELLDALVLTKERKQEIPIIGDLEPATLARIQAFYNAIAVLIEAECGLMATPLVHLSNEGFGRVLITVGKLVVHDRPLRDAHRFGFASLSKMKDEADKILSVALELIGNHSKVAGL